MDSRKEGLPQDSRELSIVLNLGERGSIQFGHVL